MMIHKNDRAKNKNIMVSLSSQQQRVPEHVSIVAVSPRGGISFSKTFFITLGDRPGTYAGRDCTATDVRDRFRCSDNESFG